MVLNRSKLVALITLAALFVVALAQHVNEPIEITVNPSQPMAGSTVTLTVKLSQVPTSQQTVNLSASPSNAYSSLPSTVTFASGQQTASVNATLSAGFSGNVTTTASNGAGSVSVVMTPRDSR